MPDTQDKPSMFSKLASYMNDVYENFLENILPNPIEIILYGILYCLIIILLNLIYYTQIQRRVKETSRCYKNRMISSTRSDEYELIGYTITNVEIVRIKYDFKNKKYIINITAPIGTVSNKMEIRVYDLKTLKMETIEKTFYAIIDYELIDKGLIFIGPPQLVRFMETGNTDFFEKILFG
jgi:hypothetical protein